MANLSGKKKDMQRGERRRAERQRDDVLSHFGQLAPRWWPLAGCVSTGHYLDRAELRNVTWDELAATWSLGEWLPDSDDPARFEAAHGRCRIVVEFFEETPQLVTAKYVAAHRAV